jgi:hypothetical protein
MNYAGLLKAYRKKNEEEEKPLFPGDQNPHWLGLAWRDLSEAVEDLEEPGAEKIEASLADVEQALPKGQCSCSTHPYG